MKKTQQSSLYTVADLGFLCARCAPQTADEIDREVKGLVERAYRRAKDLLQSNIDTLHKIAAVLIEKENIDGDEFQQIILASQAEQYLKQDAPGVTIPYQTA